MKILSFLYVSLFPILYMLCSLSERSGALMVLTGSGILIGFFHAFHQRSWKSVPLGLAALVCMDCLLPRGNLVQWYPVIVNVILFSVFSFSFFGEETVVEKLASLREPLPPEGRRYCRRVTGMWACFFVINGLISLYTILSRDLVLWGLYNGCISYCLIGLLFFGEYLVRLRVKKSFQTLAMLLAIVIAAFTVEQGVAEIPSSMKELVVSMRRNGLSQFQESFRQERSVRGLTRPIVSSGELIVSPGKRLEWIIQSPVPSRIEVTKEGILEEVHGIRSSREGSEPHRHLSQCLLTLHGGDYDEMIRMFKGKVTTAEHGFQAILVPRQDPLDHIIKEIQIEGRCYPAVVRITFFQQDSIVVYFPDANSSCEL